MEIVLSIAICPTFPHLWHLAPLNLHSLLLCLSRPQPPHGPACGGVFTFKTELERWVPLCFFWPQLPPFCKSKPGNGRPKHAQWLASIEQVCPGSLFVVKDQLSCPSYKVELSVNGQPLIMEVDTGAGVSTAPESVLAPLVPSVEFKKKNLC